MEKEKVKRYAALTGDDWEPGGPFEILAARALTVGDACRGKDFQPVSDFSVHPEVRECAAPQHRRGKQYQLQNVETVPFA